MTKKNLYNLIKKYPIFLKIVTYIFFILGLNKRKIKGKNYIQNRGALLKNVKLDIKGQNNEVVIDEGSILLNTKIYIRGNNHKLIIGKNIICKGGSLWFEDNGCSICIGRGTTIVSAHIAVTEDERKIIIGEDCMFSYDIDIRSGDSHSIIDLQSNLRTNEAENIYIGNHVWIGAHVNILKGVKINNNSVIATGATVTGKFNESNVIIGGIPGKILKTNIDWKRERI